MFSGLFGQDRHVSYRVDFTQVLDSYIYKANRTTILQANAHCSFQAFVGARIQKNNTCFQVGERESIHIEDETKIIIKKKTIVKPTAIDIY